MFSHHLVFILLFLPLPVVGNLQDDSLLVQTYYESGKDKHKVEVQKYPTAKKIDSQGKTENKNAQHEVDHLHMITEKNSVGLAEKEIPEELPGYSYNSDVFRCGDQPGDPSKGKWKRWVHKGDDRSAGDWKPEVWHRREDRNEKCPRSLFQQNDCQAVDIYRFQKKIRMTNALRLGEICYCINKECADSREENAMSHDKSNCSQNQHGIPGLHSWDCDVVEVWSYVKLAPTPPPAPVPRRRRRNSARRRRSREVCHLPGLDHITKCIDGWAVEKKVYYNNLWTDKGNARMADCKQHCTKDPNCGAIRAYRQDPSAQGLYHCRLLHTMHIWTPNFKYSGNPQDEVYARCDQCDKFKHEEVQKENWVPEQQQQPKLEKQQLGPPPGEWHDVTWPGCHGGAETKNKVRLLSPEDHGCCSVGMKNAFYSDEHMYGSCSSRHAWIKVQLDNGIEQKCARGQVCEFKLAKPRKGSAEKITYQCGDSGYPIKRTYPYALYWDFIQVRFDCGGQIKINPWWCGFHSPKWEPTFVNKLSGLTAADFQSKTKMADFVVKAKTEVCGGISMMAAYDQLLAPTSVCLVSRNYWGRTSDLYEKRSTRRRRSPAPGDSAQYCKSIGMELCKFDIWNIETYHYCVAPTHKGIDTCSEVKTRKFWKIFPELAGAITSFALKPIGIIMGGPFAAATRIATKTVKGTLKDLVKKSLLREPIVKEELEKEMKDRAKDAFEGDPYVQFAKQAMEKHAEGTLKMRIIADWSANYLKTTGLKAEAKSKLKKNLWAALNQAKCETIIEQTLGDFSDTPEWIKDDVPEWQYEVFKTLDVTGLIGLLGVFHESTCSAPIPWKAGDSCPR
jgi:hypothetical protein